MQSSAVHLQSLCSRFLVWKKPQFPPYASNLLVLKRHTYPKKKFQNQNPKPLEEVIAHHRKIAEDTWSQSITHCWDLHGQRSVVRE